MDNYMEKSVIIFKALADETRLQIISSILGEKKTVSSIVSATNVSQSCVSHQLKLLKESKIVKSERVGKNIYYSLQDTHIKEIVEQTFLHASEE